jgi:hypothetical protein
MQQRPLTSRNLLQIKEQIKERSGVLLAQVVECLLCNHEALS